MLFNRSSGILLPIASLPSDYGIGDMGPGAYRFVEWLKDAGQGLWQILPLSIADDKGCPYSSCSAYGGYPLLISVEMLVQDKFLLKKEVKKIDHIAGDHVDYDLVKEYKYFLFHKAYARFKKTHVLQEEFNQFYNENRGWLEDLSLFIVLSEQFGAKWFTWPEKLKTRQSNALKMYKQKNREQILFHQFLQFLFYRQWHQLKNYANLRGVKIVGDIPIFISHQSMDVWKNPEFFKLAAHEPYVVTGAPPDSFSATGQKWGNPNYDWHALEWDGFGWWINRLGYNLLLYDIVRLDHFRGFSATWEIPVDNPDPTSGYWSRVPGHNLFHCLGERLGHLPIIAEDLGKITPDVIELRNRFGFPGMKILQFAFDEGDYDPNLPHNFDSDNYVVYTGTHDNQTAKGWFKSAQVLEKHYCINYTNPWNEENINWTLIDLAMKSRAIIAITPIQDVIGAEDEARINVPGTTKGNWSWRLKWSDLTDENREQLLNLTNQYGRNTHHH